MTLERFAIATHSLLGPLKFAGTTESTTDDEIPWNIPSFWTFHKFPASTVMKTSAGEFAPSEFNRSIKALPLPEIIFTLIPVSAVKLEYNSASES